MEATTLTRARLAQHQESLRLDSEGKTDAPVNRHTYTDRAYTHTN